MEMTAKPVKMYSAILLLPISLFSVFFITGGKPVKGNTFNQVLTKAALDSAREHNRTTLNRIEYEINKKCAQ